VGVPAPVLPVCAGALMCLVEPDPSPSYLLSYPFPCHAHTQRVLRDVYNMKTFEDIMLSSFSMSVGEATPPVVGSSTAMPTTAMPTTAMPTTAAAATDAPLFTTVAPTSAPTGVLSPVDPVIPLLPSTAAPTIAPSSFEGDNPNEFAVSEGVVPTVHDRDAESSGKEGIATWLVVASLAMAVAVMGALWVGRRRRSPMAAGFDASGGGSSISSSSRLVEV
jgi:MYXO-CTERM domain-containing protein